jgi:hypothetical protein
VNDASWIQDQFITVFIAIIRFLKINIFRQFKSEGPLSLRKGNYLGFKNNFETLLICIFSAMSAAKAAW